MPFQIANSQSQGSNYPIRDTEFVEYYDPYSMINISYPSFWQKSNVSNSESISFVSPIKTIGVIVQNAPTLNATIDEIAMNTISFIKESFLNATILDITTSSSEDGSTIQSLTFTFVNGKDKEKVLLLSKIFEDRTFTFLYYADDILFDHFTPLTSVMLDSFQIPYFRDAFSPKDLYNVELLSREDLLPTTQTSNTTNANTTSNSSGTSESNNRQPSENQSLPTTQTSNTTNANTTSNSSGTSESNNRQPSENQSLPTTQTSNTTNANTTSNSSGTSESNNRQPSENQSLPTTQTSNTTNANTTSNSSGTSESNNQLSLDTIDFATYENNDLGIKIDYPTNFIKIENDRGSTFLNEEKNLGATIADIPIKNSFLNEFKNQQVLHLNRTLNDFNILDSEVSDFMGYPTDMILFNYKNGTQLYKGVQFIKVSNDNTSADIFTYFAPSVQVFDEFLPVAVEMFRSLELS
ncbi:hypothetical protein [Candidatus Nitrosocosmicus franklandus]|uniref:hypothetical protein n=1 Tax=Candidatus Nitrosocosmicus franklandianus TaxID=1798806 RepID=UPI001559FFD9|nr:hypothetical protein [Candidatus Nitrosocosmicus franklandus]